MEAVCFNIRNIRVRMNYSQTYLAAQLAISQNAYSKIELGYTKITLERLFEIAELIKHRSIRVAPRKKIYKINFILVPSGI
ncbi:helix-turn-helix domain-containing protein [Mucilaginibacter sp. X5P1]|uniref:helix-turn-helix domain-containing protein n=1 Tax=Mucilaginibacter sp. X5P1 TaxID=2723088 RepID=UPI002104A25E|nr:helix-turn-helix transcriptional regulator [Mucilaginibacter sp. X5P1]